MSDAFVPRVGGILSADIAVPKHESETRFYSRVLSTGARPLWREDLMNNQGMPVIGHVPRDVRLIKAIESGQASISMVQRRLRVGYNRAARMIETMEKEGIVGPADGSKPREVLVRNSY